MSNRDDWMGVGHEESVAEKPGLEVMVGAGMVGTDNAWLLSVKRINERQSGC